MIPADLSHVVARALEEDMGAGDLSAALIPAGLPMAAHIVTREPGVLCGRPYAEAVFARLSADVEIRWHAEDGQWMEAGHCVCDLEGPAQALLSGERTALNFLQTLSGVATVTRAFVDAVRETKAKILDTRKTLPGLRLAQKYAVRVGGGLNHRLGLYDGVLIKENHIAAAGSITAAVTAAKAAAPRLTRIEVEVEDLLQLEEALRAQPDMILLDNFSVDLLAQAVRFVDGAVPLEASGNVTLENVREVAETGVDYISIGRLTRHLKSLDLSMRFVSGGS